MTNVEFETDLEPATGMPRLRFNFSNGCSASLIIRTTIGSDFDAMTASVAAAPNGKWGIGSTILGPTEASADEAIKWLDDVRRGIITQHHPSPRVFASEEIAGGAETEFRFKL